MPHESNQGGARSDSGAAKKRTAARNAGVQKGTRDRRAPDTLGPTPNHPWRGMGLFSPGKTTTDKEKS